MILTSAFHGYEVEVEVDFLPGPSFPTSRAVSRRRVPFTLTFPYVPEPFWAELLMLSALGGWLRSRGTWTPPNQVPRRFLSARISGGSSIWLRLGS